MNATQTVTDPTTAPMTQAAGAAPHTPGSGERCVVGYTSPKDDARALLSRVVKEVYGTDHPPNVTLRTREGHAAHVLVEESKTAQLLVIGSRGLGEVAGLLLGSVSARCAEKAHCPVLIMHSPDPS